MLIFAFNPLHRGTTFFQPAIFMKFFSWKETIPRGGVKNSKPKNKDHSNEQYTQLYTAPAHSTKCCLPSYI